MSNGHATDIKLPIYPSDDSEHALKKSLLDDRIPTNSFSKEEPKKMWPGESIVLCVSRLLT